MQPEPACYNGDVTAPDYELMRVIRAEISRLDREGALQPRDFPPPPWQEALRGRPAVRATTPAETTPGRSGEEAEPEAP